MPPLGYALAQLHGIYILAQNEPAWCWSTCTPRTNASSTSGSRAGIEAGPPPTQALLVPGAARRQREEIATAEEQAEALAALGFEIAAAGPRQLAVRAVPALLAGGDVAALLRALLGRTRRASGQPRRRPRGATNCSPPWPATAPCAAGAA